MKDKVIQQHFVPRFYLENFTDSNGMLWTFDKTNSRRFKRKPSEIATQRYFYDVPEIDKFSESGQLIDNVFKPIEDQAAGILQNWMKELTTGRIGLQQNDKHPFSLFLALQFLRTPEHRKKAIQTLAARYGHVSQASARFPKNKESLITAQSILNSELVQNIAAAFFDHIWIFSHNLTDRPFYTSDHPLILKSSFPDTWHGGLGVLSDGIQIFYPLSPHFILHMLEREHWKKWSMYDGGLSPFPYTEEIVKHDNSGQVAFSTRFVYCMSDHFEFADEMCDRHPESRNPDRQRIQVAGWDRPPENK